jgi:hypothetical protein
VSRQQREIQKSKKKLYLDRQLLFCNCRIHIQNLSKGKRKKEREKQETKFTRQRIPRPTPNLKAIEPRNFDTVVTSWIWYRRPAEKAHWESRVRVGVVGDDGIARLWVARVASGA